MNKVVIEIEGGSIRNVTSREPLEIVVVDRDIDGLMFSNIHTVDGEEAYIYQGLTESVVNPEYVGKDL